MPLQPARTFSKHGDGLPACNAQAGWHNMLIFGDNLQAMKAQELLASKPSWI
ncbi:MAG TPA: hypothetical protein VNO52_08145 [Methylomirabilota bacterium]|nr:hypothetical protein [Methylomirabilota bacterium]